MVALPFVQSRDELPPLRFDKHEIAHCKFTHLAILKCGAEIFPAVLNPAFANPDMRVGVFFRFDVDLQMSGRDVIANSSVLLLRNPQQDFNISPVAHRGLRVDIELAQRFDLVTEEFNAHR